MKKSELKKLIKEELEKIVIKEAKEFYKDIDVKGKNVIRGGLNLTASMNAMEENLIEFEIDTYSSYPGSVFIVPLENK